MWPLAQSCSEAKTESQAGSELGSEEGGSSSNRGESEDGSSQHGDSGSKVEESRSNAEESGSESSSSSSQSEAAAKKVWPDRKTSEPDPNTSQPISLRGLDSKDNKEGQKTNCHGFACHMDTDFGTWRDKKISEGLKQWDEPVTTWTLASTLILWVHQSDYMENCSILKPIKWGSLGTFQSSLNPASL